MGLFPYPIKKDCNKLDCRVRLAIQKILFSETLVALEPRGKDSSGIGLLWNDKKTAVLKQPIPAHKFARDDGTFGKDFVNPEYPEVNYKWLMSLWDRGVDTDKYLRAAIGHVRKGTQGSPYDAHNNHPIIVPPTGKPTDDSPLVEGTIVGVHNGGIQNDRALFNKNKFDQIGEVDSEIIFQLMKEYKDDFSIENLSKTFDALEGAYAVMAYNNAHPNKIGCIREVRPMEAAYSPELGTLIIVSERKYLDEAWNQYDRWRVRESNREFTFIDTDGEIKSLGKVGDLFPYVSYSWYGGTTPTNSISSIESGVFILNLDTEVDTKTEPEDLIEVTKKYKKASTTYSTGSYGGHRQNFNTPGKDTRSAAATNKDKKDETDLEKVEATIIDTTCYEVKEEDVDIEFDESDSGIQVEIDKADLEDSQENETCPYSWDELKEFGKHSLYDQEQQDNDNLTLNQDSTEIKKRLTNYLIPCKDEDSANIITACMYDLVFPEGFAIGFMEGYEQAGEEYTAIMEQEKSKRDSDTDLSKLEQAKIIIEKLAEKKRKASKTFEAVRPVLSALLRDAKIIDEDGNVDRGALDSLSKFSGAKNASKCSSKIIGLVSKKTVK